MTARVYRGRPSGWRYRANVAIRTLTATVGGYVVAALTAAMLARTLPLSRVEAVTTGTMLAYLVVPGVAVWAFLARGPWRALASVIMIAALLGLTVWMAGPPA
ncbi:MAG: ketohydroxyglutarate aldolase [Sphingomonadaceae bacterium]|nr:ketohydroxyglutarate aldolase [Sphingomonadaceae bacterium]